MKVFTFSGHHIAMSDIVNVRIGYNYHALQMYVDIELQGGATMSLSLPDSLIFIEAFTSAVRAEHNIN